MDLTHEKNVEWTSLPKDIFGESLRNTSRCHMSDFACTNKEYHKDMSNIHKTLGRIADNMKAQIFRKYVKQKNEIILLFTQEYKECDACVLTYESIERICRDKEFLTEEYIILEDRFYEWKKIKVRSDTLVPESILHAKFAINDRNIETEEKIIKLLRLKFKQKNIVKVTKEEFLNENIHIKEYAENVTTGSFIRDSRNSCYYKAIGLFEYSLAETMNHILARVKDNEKNIPVTISDKEKIKKAIETRFATAILEAMYHIMDFHAELTNFAKKNACTQEKYDQAMITHLQDFPIKSPNKLRNLLPLAKPSFRHVEGG